MVISYSQACCKVIGYQYGTPDAVSNRGDAKHDNIITVIMLMVSVSHMDILISTFGH